MGAQRGNNVDSYDADRAQPGFYKVHQTQGGPWSPVHIFEPVLVECQGDGACQPVDRWRGLVARRGWELVPVGWVWPYCGRWPIKATEYLHRLRLIQWANTSGAWAPEANPRRRIDLSQLPSLY